MQAQPLTAADLERQLAAARARLAEIPGELSAAEAERDELYAAWLASKELVAEASRVLLGLSQRVQLGHEIIIVANRPEQRNRAEAEEAERRSRQAQAGLELARTEERAAVRAYNRASRRCHDLSAERGRLESRASAWERQVEALHGREEANRAQLVEARGWLTGLRARLAGA